jgi:hypothetical protein
MLPQHASSSRLTNAFPTLPHPTGQEAVLGHNLLCDKRCEAQWPAYNMTKYLVRRGDVLRAISRAPHMTMAGPYKLVQGTTNAIARLP